MPRSNSLILQWTFLALEVNIPGEKGFLYPFRMPKRGWRVFIGISSHGQSQLGMDTPLFPPNHCCPLAMCRSLPEGN